jgi:hypothetical protein
MASLVILYTCASPCSSTVSWSLCLSSSTSMHGRSWTLETRTLNQWWSGPAVSVTVAKWRGKSSSTIPSGAWRCCRKGLTQRGYPRGWEMRNACQCGPGPSTNAHVRLVCLFCLDGVMHPLSGGVIALLHQKSRHPNIDDVELQFLQAPGHLSCLVRGGCHG